MYSGGSSISQFGISGYFNMTDYYYMAPGEEKYFGINGYFNVPQSREIDLYLKGGASSQCYLSGASSICNYNNTINPGTLQMDDFGFEYIEYIEQQQITKRQRGIKPLIIKCR